MTSPVGYHSLRPNADDQLYERDSEVWSVTEPDRSIPQHAHAPAVINRRPLPSKPHGTILSVTAGNDDRSDPSSSLNEAQVSPCEDEEEDAPELSPRKAGWWLSLVADTWTLELIAGFISFAALASIVGVLWSYDHKPVPALMKGITLNAVISFLATISRTAIMLCIGTVLSQGKWLWFRKKRSLMDLQTIENASRGPLGSAVLLANLKSSPVLCLAAILTIAALGFDPFVQQLLTVQTRVVAEAGVGIAINAADTFDAIGNAMKSPKTLAQIAAAMLADVGQYTPASASSGPERRLKRVSETIQPLSPLMPACPSSNCVWDPYYAIDICTRCRNTTPEMKLVVATSSNFSDPVDAFTYAWDQGVQGAPTFLSKYTTANMTWDLIPENGNSWQFESSITSTTDYGNDSLPDDQSMIFMEGSVVRKIIWPLNFGGITNYSQYTEQAWYYLQDWSEGEFAGIGDPVAAIGYASFGVGNFGQPVLENALECALTYCVKEFNRSVVQGSLVSNILSQSYGNISGADGQQPSWSALVNGTQFNLSDATTTVTYGTGIVTLLDSLLGTATHYYASYYGAFETFPTGQLNWTEGEGVYQTEYPSPWQGIDYTDNFTTVLQNINTIVSDMIQQYGGTSIPGKLAVTKSFVVVRWPWIALPATTILVGLVTFAIVIWDTRKLGAPKWGSSLLPLLYKHVALNTDSLTIDGNNPTRVTGKEGQLATDTSLEGSNLISRFEIEAEATALRFGKVGSRHGVWQLQSLEVVHKHQQAWWHRLKWW